MKRFPLLFVLLLYSISCSAWRRGGEYSRQHPDTLLLTLDRTIADRDSYVMLKFRKIDELKRQRENSNSDLEIFRINERIIDNYTSFLSDSASRYIHENIRIAQKLNDKDLLVDSKLKLALNYSLSGLFLQASSIFDEIDYNRLNTGQKPGYCWNRIRYYEQLKTYTNEPEFSNQYDAEINRLRDSLIRLLPDGSELQAKEKAFKLQGEGRLNEALGIFMALLEKETPNTHNYAMNAMGIATLYRQLGNRTLENHFLKIAAINDVKTAVKENEALLSLATNLFEQGDVSRAYKYIHSALEDSNFYNSRFKSTVIARVQPIIESNYLQQIKQQQRNLRIYVILLSVLVGILIVFFIILWRQKNAIARSRESIREINNQLREAHIIKEQYIGYFMNQCSHYINKLYLYRKEVNHKIKNGQTEQLYKPSTKELEKEIDELLKNFDQAFLILYPKFVERFNTLLLPEAQYKLEDNRLNTELRIFALMRLGITNVNQIADFLHCSLQTIYNYKSKVKSKARPEIVNIEEEVKRMRLAIPNALPSNLPKEPEQDKPIN